MDKPEAPNQRWWNEDAVAVVTGANKGIGYAIVRQLAENGIRVVLTARDEERGKSAAKNLNEEGFHNIVFHQLDVKDAISVDSFANWMKDHYGKLDILYIPSETLRQQLGDLHDLTEKKIDAFLQSFLKDFQQGLLKTKGWPVTYSAYFISKAAVNAYTRILARQHPDMYVNCVHPGFVNTDMNFNVGRLSIDEGSKGPVMVALLPPGSTTGQYYDETEMASFYVLPKKESP